MSAWRSCLCFLILQDGEIDLKLLTNVLSPETEVFEVGIYTICHIIFRVKNKLNFWSISVKVFLILLNPRFSVNTRKFPCIVSVWYLEKC